MRIVIGTISVWQKPSTLYIPPTYILLTYRHATFIGIHAQKYAEKSKNKIVFLGHNTAEKPFLPKQKNKKKKGRFKCNSGILECKVEK